MKITGLHLKNFKRFNDLQIKNIANETKLILLIGANGAGKSCIFDAFSFADGVIKRDPISMIDFKPYFKKKESQLTQVQMTFDDYPPIDISDDTFNATFKKGNSTFHYDYLSAGEKEVFNLIFNLRSRARLYQNTIYYLDEMDLHLNTQLQYDLLKEIVEHWIPKDCQLWTASHSLGFIEYAKQSETAAILDFGNYDFDLPRILTPKPKENPN